MKLLTLTINNFLSFETAKLDLDAKGLVAVQGINLDGNGADSNGSGKSSLFIAILWCLYGSTDKDIAADDVINSKVGKNCSVETVWLDTNGIKYRITRYRKHSKHKDKLAFEIMHPGLDWDNKTLGKNALTQTSVNQAIGMDETVFKASCFASQEDPIDIPAMRDSELKKLLEDSLPFAKFDPLHKKYKAKADDLSKQLEALNRKLLDDNHSLDINQRLLSEQLAQSKDWLEVSSKQRDDINAQIAKLVVEIAALKAKLPDLDRLNALQSRIQAKIKELGVGDAAAVQMRLNGLKTALANALVNTVKSDTCPTCSQIVNAETAEEINLRVARQVAKIEADIGEAEGRLQTIRDNVGNHDKLSEKWHENEYVISQAVTTKNAIFIREKEIDMQNNLLSRMSGGNPFLSSIERLTEETKKIKDRLEERKKQVEELKPDLYLYTNLAEATSPKGFRYHMLESVTPDLNRATNKYLAMLTDGKITAVWSTVTKLSSGDYKEAFSIRVNMNGRTGFGALSGGQKKKVRLACWFALQDMIANRASKDVKLWVCDEVDGALDKAGVERLMSLLEEKSRTKETVLVISHNNLKDWIANGITVSMEGDTSKVSGFLNVI